MSSNATSIKDLHTIIFDFDGVFTDNFVYVDDRGTESVRCSRADSYGISILKKFTSKLDLKIDVFVLSTETNQVVIKRCKKMGIDCHFGKRDKAEYLAEWYSKNRPGLPDPYAGTLYFGNDLNDLPVMQKVGTSFAPADAHPRIKEIATQVLMTRGGFGFVREGIELILGTSAMTQGELSEFISNS